MENKKISFKDTLKSADTEEFIDIWFYRPIGYCWALLFRKLGITPNIVTIASIFIGVAAGILFYYDNLLINIYGMLLLIWANSYDSADGQLARMTGQSSNFGRILDGVCGDLWFFSIYIALCLRLQNAGFDWYIVWPLALTAGFFHSKQAAMADYYRNIHLLFLKGKSGSEVDNSTKLTEKYNTLSWNKDFWNKIVLFFYRNYTITQEKSTPALQKMLQVLQAKYEENVPEWFKTEFRAKSKPLMKYTNMLSFNTRVIALFVGLFLNQVWIYFAFELTVLNIMLIYMVRTHEGFCKGFTKKIEKIEG
ncbi:MAG: CDP-alcohol phosphatidyltransferase family protein [Candidatus Azobacteroides sp.]|nr:CDP-alcohol phosphatidyltransferase family protein [Candidatus Azobacteroides sp.]